MKNIQIAHKHFTKEQKRKAKLNHKKFVKFHPEAHDTGIQELISKTVDLFVRECSFDCKLSLVN